MAGEMKHTPGPWAQSGACVVAEAPLRFIATIGAPSSRDDEDAANGRLMAAAPDLLSALKAQRPIIVALIDAGYNVETWGLAGRLAALDAALSKSGSA